MKVSVIVPVYKVAPFLEKCLKSLAFQSLRELEILVVDDGSPDDSSEIIGRFAKAFPERVKAFSKPNGGLSDARNFGLERASGEYVAFLDGDDYADLDLYERLYEAAKERDADLAVCNARYVFPDGKMKEVSSGFSKDMLSKKELKPAMARFYPAAWNKLYRRSLLEESGVRFKKGAWFEDVEFCHRLYPAIGSLVTVPFSCVNYVQREGGVTQTSDLRLFDYLSNWESILAFYREKGLFEEYRRELEFACARYLFATFLKRAAGLPDREDFERAISEAVALVKKHFPHYKRNPYLLKTGLKGLYLLFFSPALAKLLRKKNT